MKKEKERFLLSVTVREDLHQEVKEVCERLDIPMTVWCREAIKAKLKQQNTGG